MSLHFRKGFCPLSCLQKAPHLFPARARGQGEGVASLSGAAVGKGANKVPPSPRSLLFWAPPSPCLWPCPSPRPCPSWSPLLRLLSQCYPLLELPTDLRTPPCTPTPSRRVPWPPRPHSRLPSPSLTGPLSWIWGPGGWAGRGLRAGGGSRPACNAGKPRVWTQRQCLFHGRFWGIR